MLKLYRCDCTTRALSARRARWRHRHPAPGGAYPNWQNAVLYGEEMVVIGSMDDLPAYYRSDKVDLFAPLLRVAVDG